MALAVAALGIPGAAGAAGFRLFQSASVLGRSVDEARDEFGLGHSGAAALAVGRAADGFDLGLHFPAPLTQSLRTEIRSPLLRPDLPARRPRPLLITIAAAGTVAGSVWDSVGDGPHQKFHFTDEGFFDPGTYAGGGDKASHLVSYNAVARLMTGVYELLDLPTDRARLLGSATSLLAGLATEVGDGTTKYGFSYEDLVLDTIGAGSAWLIAHYGAEDLIGFRAGVMSAPRTPPLYFTAGIGKDYTREIYTADLKLAGLAARVNRRFGPARFLLISTTYSAKGYPYARQELRERQIGLEVGLNVAEMARAVGVPQERWWGKMLLTVLEIIRIPYTAVGWRYDLNHHRWKGPDAGDGFEFPGR